MKTLAKLLYVEPDEEVTDVVDRLRELQGEPAVTLVLPDGARALHSPMSFRLLKKYAQAYRLQVSVVSGETRLQALSLESSFPTYASIQALERGLELLQPGSAVALDEEAAPDEVERASSVPAFQAAVTPRPVVSAPPRRMPLSGVPLLRVPRLRERLQQHRRPIYIGAAVLAALAFLAGILSLPSATVIMTVQGTKLDADVQLAGTPGPQAPGVNQFTTQAFSVTESQQAQGTATGQKAIAAIASSGSVTFTYNCVFFCSVGYFDVPKGVVVRTADGAKSYATDKGVHVPSPHGSASVSVIATAAGPAGNTDAHSIKQIDNNRDANVSVDNAAAITGGADARTATVISDSDMATAGQALLDILNPKVESELNQKTGTLHLVQESLTIDHTATVDHKIGDELPAATPTFAITMTVTGKATAFNDAAVRQLIQHALQVPAGRQLTEDPVTTSYEVVSAGADGKVTLTGHARGFVRPIFPLADIRARLKGRSPNSARPLLLGWRSVVDVNVRQDLPLPWLPFFASRIVVKVQEATGGFAS